jgi:hypothetical protein
VCVCVCIYYILYKNNMVHEIQGENLKPEPPTALLLTGRVWWWWRRGWLCVCEYIYIYIYIYFSPRCPFNALPKYYYPQCGCNDDDARPQRAMFRDADDGRHVLLYTRVVTIIIKYNIIHYTRVSCVYVFCDTAWGYENGSLMDYILYILYNIIILCTENVYCSGAKYVQTKKSYAHTRISRSTHKHILWQEPINHRHN